MNTKLFLSVVLSLSVGSAFAESIDLQLLQRIVMFRVVCEPDIRKYCSDFTDDGESLILCVEKNNKKLNAECRGEIASLKKERGALISFIRGCKVEVEKICPGVDIMGGKLEYCLNQRKKHLTPGCRKKFEAARKEG